MADITEYLILSKDLLRTVPLNKLKIEDICKACACSRSTFFRVFKSKNGFISEHLKYEDQLIFDILVRPEKDRMENVKKLADLLESDHQFLSYVMKNGNSFEYVEGLLINAGRAAEQLIEDFESRESRKIREDFRSFLAQDISEALVSSTAAFFRSGDKDKFIQMSANHMSKIYLIFSGLRLNLYNESYFE